MEVESEDEDDGREDRHEGQPAQPDQDTQVQDMDEVRADVIFMSCIFENFNLFYLLFLICWPILFHFPFQTNIFFTTYGTIFKCFINPHHCNPPAFFRDQMMMMRA